MSAEPMLRTLAAQAEAIWPQERPLLLRYALPEGAQILDLGCGPGEVSSRLLELFEGASLLGLDLDEAHLGRARLRCAAFGERARFHLGDAVELELEADRFDLSVCRHLLQAVPDPKRVLANLARVTRPGGILHVLAEDYSMIHFAPTERDLDRFWAEGPLRFAEAVGTDLRSGRKAYSFMKELGLREVRVDYVTVDVVRVDRATFARIWRAWRDGYAEAIAEHTALSEEEVHACFAEMIECIESPEGYAVWQVPIISGRVP